MDTLKLGQIIEGEQHRDAIHIAVAPVVAAEELEPGDEVGLVEGEATKKSVACIGIVDPFLKDVVRKGQKFWLFLNPNTVTGMRHHWRHPMFCDEQSVATDSEIWLRAYAMRMNCYDTPQKAFDRLISGLRSGDLRANGSDLHGLFDLDDAHDLQFHAQNYLGIPIDFGSFSFSCSC